MSVGICRGLEMQFKGIVVDFVGKCDGANVLPA